MRSRLSVSTRIGTTSANFNLTNITGRGHIDRGDQRNAAKRDSQRRVRRAAGGDGDVRRSASERRNGDVRCSSYGTGRHIRERDEHGHRDDQRQRRGHLDHIHRERVGRNLYRNGYRSQTEPSRLTSS